MGFSASPNLFRQRMLASYGLRGGVFLVLPGGPSRRMIRPPIGIELPRFPGVEERTKKQPEEGT